MKKVVLTILLIIVLGISLITLTGCGEAMKAGVDQYQKSQDILDGSSLDAVREKTEEQQKYMENNK